MGVVLLAPAIGKELSLWSRGEQRLNDSAKIIPPRGSRLDVCRGVRGAGIAPVP